MPSDIRIYMLIIQGSLEFDRKDVYLDANYIFVFGGHFVVGTESEPFLQKAIITLYGSPVSQEIPIYGAKTLSVRFGTLDLHGQPLLDGRTHTKLARTAFKGDTELWLTERVGWCTASGAQRADELCQIGLSSTNRRGWPWDYETNNIVAVTHGGYRLVLGARLQFDHMGETRFVAGGHSVEFRANVALLSSNVVVQGETTFSRLDRHGVHIFLHSREGGHSIIDQSQGNSLTARIDNAEVRYAGQFARLGRYPIHFHMSGVVSNSYVKHTRIHHTYHRCIAIHGVHYLRFTDNVCFENMVRLSPSLRFLTRLHSPYINSTTSLNRPPSRFRRATRSSLRTHPRQRTSSRATSSSARARVSPVSHPTRAQRLTGWSTATITSRTTLRRDRRTMVFGSSPSGRSLAHRAAKRGPRLCARQISHCFGLRTSRCTTTAGLACASPARSLG